MHPDQDIIDIMVTLTLGSLDTLKSQLGWQLYHLATHPDDQALTDLGGGACFNDARVQVTRA